jgi:LacI family transcriptional regulator, repressor for deo operon, udp, cdd, tsx, nupC, and nupG
VGATRRQVAEAAHVSVRTVSNVVNGFASVAPETRTRVLRAVADLGYRPSPIARMLKAGRSGLIALVLPDLDTPYFAELTRAFVELGAKRGYTIVIDQTDGDVAREMDLVGRTENGSLFDGLIVSPLGLRTGDLPAIPPERPVIFLGEDVHEGFDQVRIDNFAAAAEAVAHLVNLGRKRIAAIGAQPSDIASSSIRLAGYRRGLEAAGLPFVSEYVGYVDAFRRSDGAAAMARLLDVVNPPDAVFCFSDPLALGALRVLHERGYVVPRDVAVVGFDDIEDGRFSTPTLSSISPDKAFIASQTLALLAARLDGTAYAPASYLAPHKLIVRESSTL